MSKPLDNPALDRREFIGVTGALAATSLMPGATLLHAAPSIVPATQLGHVSDWTIDDMWGVYPRPSEPIGFGRPRAEPVATAHVEPVDALFVP